MDAAIAHLSDRHDSADLGGAVIRPLHFAQERSVAGMLTRAFAADPLVRAICIAPAKRLEAQMRWSFRMAVRAHCLSPQPAWTVSDPSAGVVGVALVSRPSMNLLGQPDTWFTLRGLLHVGVGAARRGLRVAEAIAAHAPAPPYTYLRTLGVDPLFHGRGYGSQLVRHVVRAAPPVWPLYLETAKEENLAFYAKHGLHCMGEFRCLDVRVWRLMRPAPQPVLRVDMRSRLGRP